MSDNTVLSHRFTLRSKMLLMFGTVFALSMITFGLIISYGVPFTRIEGMNSTLRKDAIERLSHLADMKKEELMTWLTEHKGDMRFSSESVLLREHVDKLRLKIEELEAGNLTQDEKRKRLVTGDDYKLVTQHLQSWANVYEKYDEIMIVDAPTWIIAASTSEDHTGQTFSDKKWFEKILSPEYDEIIEVRKDPLTGKRYLYIVNAMKAFQDFNAGEVRTTAVLIAKIDVNEFIMPLQYAGRDLGETSEINLINENGDHLTTLKHPMPGHDKHTHFGPAKLARPAALAINGIEGIITDMDYRGVKVLAAIRHIQVTAETAWGMVIKIDEHEVFTPMRKNILHYVALSLLGALIVLVLTYIIATRLSEPLEQLSSVVRKIEAGDLTARSSVATSDEVGSLSFSFNAMADRIQSWNAELERQVRERTDDLRDSEEKIRAVSDTSMDAIIIMDHEGIISYFNPAAEKMFGYSKEESVGKVLHDFLVSEKSRQEYHLMLPEFAKTGYCKVIGKLLEVNATRKDGSIFPVELTVSALKLKGQWHSAGTIRDITERKKLEAQLMQAQKMESIGVLAGGVAHDFNNALTAIIGFAYILKSRLKDDASVSQHVEHIISVCNRAAGTVSSLLAFSRKQMIAPRPVDLNNIVGDVEMLLKNLIGEDIDLTIRVCANPLVIIADPAQLDQIIINLATNARDAMPKGGRLTIETDRFYIDEESAKVQLFSRPGPYARLIVSDTGVGIDEKIMDMIFEPFYTTKDVDKGTGLGLAMVYGLIKQHDGNIIVSSEPGKGTTFVIYLPIREDAVLETIMPRPEESSEGTETILVAEDNNDVRITFKSILEKSGYTVITAVDGEDAVSKFRENKDAVRLCILDVIMPKRSGKDVYDELRTITPDIKALFISGYTGDILDRQEILDRDLDFISKPFSPGTLLKKVQEVLAKGSDS